MSSSTPKPRICEWAAMRLRPRRSRLSETVEIGYTHYQHIVSHVYAIRLTAAMAKDSAERLILLFSALLNPRSDLQKSCRACQICNLWH